MTSKRQHLVLMRPGFEEALKDEFRDHFGLQGEVACRAGVAFAETAKLPPLKNTIFARQMMPRSIRISAEELADAVKVISARIDVLSKRSNRQSGRWTLHAFAIDDDDRLALARKVAKGVMQRIRDEQKEFFLRYIPASEFTKTEPSSADIVFQIYASSSSEFWFSSASIAEGISPWEAGFQRMRTLPGAPSRSASKLEEALLRLGKKPSVGDTAVDLGAAPGGWSFVLASHGAHVIAVDHANLSIKNLSKLKGSIEHLKDNGLTFMPERQVDWMVCDMVMGARDTLKVLKAWLDADAMQHFIVNLKLPKTNPWPMVHEAMNLLKGYDWSQITGQHLLHDRSEITLLGSKF